VPYAKFHVGYKLMDLRPGEIIARIVLPPRSGSHAWRSYYRKVGTRRAQAISKVCLAGLIRVEANAIQDVRIAFGSVAPTVIRALASEEALRGQPLDADTIAAAERTLLTEIAPIDDIRSTARYRARVAANLLREFLTT
jgi:CO/xanthine dehydrogenase FAD-binding subunit